MITSEANDTLDYPAQTCEERVSAYFLVITVGMSGLIGLNTQVLSEHLPTYLSLTQEASCNSSVKSGYIERVYNCEESPQISSF